ncbi:hypothetical protein PSN45_001034 [Yamadazyma tenuis]|uniref:Beta-lactamase-related domain-containing protein n=1 Tax=Candida tenuis (strain ATCC 10573 / BCRC 21748 / CBS 615 / JCM 9827 / NBRC 10315 / NRRL Y-1498 / VKM Y-70) TaxID=590646 RepID=G3B7S3_CANTC|nr:uncharacterized protein CANTEDRAFT_136236 [Yamadazyma tenuis ATCC 10573]EGV62309.1 hypothetical protein CANTEDRAFT_136236 [Yamadazyma tenuis ATCC 10573]WEJ93567.1 hypothetical protein PSN45_001034 [Yamadazyma tenuis]
MVTTEQIRSIAKKLDKLLVNVTESKSPEKQPKVPGVVLGVTDANETLYFNYNGVLDLESNTPVTKDTVFCYFSCTKALTAFGLLKLYEQKKLSLDDEVRKYVPDIDELYIVDKGTVDPNTGHFTKPPRKPSTAVTIKHLLTMTAGMSYPFLSKEYSLLGSLRNPHISSGTPTRDLFKTDKTPLIGEPGQEFSYGHSMDWVGLVIESITGKTLGQYLKEVLFDPVGMSSCTFHVKNTQHLIRTHLRGRNGKIRLYPKGTQLDPVIDMGGQGCFGNVEDYLKFIRLWINFGYSPDAGKRLLQEDLAVYAVKNHLPANQVIKFDIPDFPDLKDGFTLAGMAVTEEEPATGRPVGSVYWSGLANLYYWVDHVNKIGGFWGSQILPMADPHSFLGYCKMEMAVYDTLGGDDDDDSDEDEDDGEDDGKPYPRL